MHQLLVGELAFIRSAQVPYGWMCLDPKAIVITLYKLTATCFAFLEDFFDFSYFVGCHLGS